MRVVAAMGLLFALSGCAEVRPLVHALVQSDRPPLARDQDGHEIKPVALASGNPSAAKQDVKRGLVIVIDGAGHFQSTTHNLHSATRDVPIPMAIETFEWGHGFCRILADHMDREYIDEQGRQLAEKLREARKRVGADAPIYVLAQSGGCPLVQVAVESLPADIVDRIILLAPPCTADYDLTATLRCARESVNVVYSPHDRFILGVCTYLFGTSDRRWTLTPAAGRVGFRPPANASPETLALYTKLRQYCWQPEMLEAGYNGGHLSVNSASFLQSYILPLLQDDTKQARK